MNRQYTTTAVRLYVFLCMFGSAQPAYAYLDPGIGSMMLQLLLGGVAGVLVVVKLYWRNLKNIFRRNGRQVSGSSVKGDK